MLVLLVAGKGLRLAFENAREGPAVLYRGDFPIKSKRGIPRSRAANCRKTAATWGENGEVCQTSTFKRHRTPNASSAPAYSNAPRPIDNPSRIRRVP